MRNVYTEERDGDQQVFEMDTQSLPKELSKPQVLLLNLTYLGINAMFLVMSVEVVPSQIEGLVGPAAKGRWLGGMVGGAAIFTIICGPLVGMRSDRLVSKYGRRRPVMLVATLFLCVGLFGLAFSAPYIKIQKPNGDNGKCHIDLEAKRCAPYENSSLSDVLQSQDNHIDGRLSPMNSRAREVEVTSKNANIGLFVVFFFLVMSSLTSLTVPYNALIADKSHPNQRGFSSGVMGFMVLFGNITGAGLGIFFVEMGVLVTYTCVTALLLVCVVITAATTAEEPGKTVHPPIDWKNIFIGFWKPLKEPDFRWVFITRFLMQQGLSTVIAFLEYWLSDMTHLPHCWSAERAVSVMLLPLLFTAAFGSIVCGTISDRLGRRKPLVIISALTMCVVATTFAFIRGDYAFYIAVVMAVFFGCGFGCYQAVDFALVMDVLPEERDKAKDLAVWHQALILPQALATPVGGLVVDVFEQVNCKLGLGYIILFLISGTYFLLSAVFVVKIKKAR